MPRLALLTEYPTAVLAGGQVLIMPKHAPKYFLILPDTPHGGSSVLHLNERENLLPRALLAAHPGCRWARAVQQYRAAVNGHTAARKFYDEVFKHYVMMVLTK